MRRANLLRRAKVAQDLVRAPMKRTARLGGNRGRHEIRNERMDDTDFRTVELHERIAGQLVEALQLFAARHGAKRVQITCPAENSG